MPAGRSVSATISASSSAESGAPGRLEQHRGPDRECRRDLVGDEAEGEVERRDRQHRTLGHPAHVGDPPSAAGSVSSRITSPDQVRISSAAQRNTDTARPTSARAQDSACRSPR